MNLVCIGVNFRTSPIEVREQLHFSDEDCRSILPILKEAGIRESVLISTCNRTELYYAAEDSSIQESAVWNILLKHKGVNDNVPGGANYFTLKSLNAVRHLFKLACGVDSMVLGDVQVLNQIKTSFLLSRELRSAGSLFNKLFEQAIHTGKRARTESEIGAGAVSVGYAAAELASKIFSDFTQRTVLLLGAGDTAELTAKHLQEQHLGKLLIANRTLDHAEGLAGRLGGHAIPFEKFKNRLTDVDMIISSISVPSFILSVDDLRLAMKLRGNKPLFIIDLGVPRNIDPGIHTIPNVLLHDVDGLHHIVDQNLLRRKRELPGVSQIIHQEIVQFHQWHKSLQVTPTIKELREQFEEIRTDEVKKILARFSPDVQHEVTMLTRQIVNKILHTPLVQLKSDVMLGDNLQLNVSMVRTLFGLNR